MTFEEPVVEPPVSYLVKKDSHGITGVLMGRPHPPVLGVIIGVTPGETDSEHEYAKAVRANALGAHTLTDVTTNDDTKLRERALKTLDIVFGTDPPFWARLRASPERAPNSWSSTRLDRSRWRSRCGKARG